MNDELLKEQEIDLDADFCVVWNPRFFWWRDIKLNDIERLKHNKPCKFYKELADGLRGELKGEIEE